MTFEQLKGTILDRSLPLEARLRAHMQLDAIIWRRRSVATEAHEADRITTSKQRAEKRRLARTRAERIAAGLPVRPRRVTGTIRATESADAFGHPPGVCIACGKRFDSAVRLRSMTCSHACSRALRRARKAVNGGKSPQNRASIRSGTLPAMSGHGSQTLTHGHPRG